MAVEALPEKSSENHIKLVADIVSAFVSNNSVPLADLPALILSVHETLAGVGSAQASVSEPLVPAVSVKKSITSDFLICLEDGKRFKSLRRHLGKLGMTPEEYRTKWSLPSDYPMVAPAYSATRSALAKSIGLGINNTRAAAATMKPSAKTKGPARGRGRPKKFAA